TPGLFTVQHAGGGKANQYFLRGFDIDHGTDLALSIDGVPINMPSHAHGQGYADLHFVTPELVERIDVTKGPYDARNGDFATAGAANLISSDHVHQSFAKASVGQSNSFRALLVGAPELDDRVSSWVAAEVFGQDGPYIHPEGLRRVNLVAHLGYRPDERTAVAFHAQSYVSGWN